MGTLQNPSPNPYPNRNPLQNPHPTPSPNSNPSPGPKSPSFEEASKLFSLPLSDAADILGVCPSVLKKVCYDNGLVRWPYRKFHSGKSIEEIKKEAAIEKEKQLAELKVAGERTDSVAGSAVSSSIGRQPQITSMGSLQETPTIRILSQQPTKDNQIDGPHNFYNSAVSKGSSATFDEFKYGFPSAGLSSVSFRWWGNKNDNDNGTQQSGSEDDKEMKQQCKDSEDAAANLSSANGDATEGKKNETDVDAEWASLLTGLRKRAAEDGRRALRLGVYKGYNAKTLDRAQKTVLLRIFKSSLPAEWGDISSES